MSPEAIKLSIHPNLLNLALDWLGLNEQIRAKESEGQGSKWFLTGDRDPDKLMSELMTTIIEKWLKTNRQLDDLEAKNRELEAEREQRSPLIYVAIRPEDMVIMGTFTSRGKAQQYREHCEEKNMTVQIIDTVPDCELSVIE